MFCTRNKHGGARQPSRYEWIPWTAVTIMIDISSLEHVLKCLTRQNILTELMLDSSFESLDMCFFFFEQLPLLATHDPECLVQLSVPGNRVLKLLRHVVRATKFSVPNKSVDAFAKPTWRSCLFHHCFHFSKMRRIRLTKERTITDQTMWKVLLTFPECCVGKFMPA